MHCCGNKPQAQNQSQDHIILNILRKELETTNCVGKGGGSGQCKGGVECSRGMSVGMKKLSLSISSVAKPRVKPWGYREKKLCGCSGRDHPPIWSSKEDGQAPTHQRWGSPIGQGVWKGAACHHRAGGKEAEGTIPGKDPVRGKGEGGAWKGSLKVGSRGSISDRVHLGLKSGWPGAKSTKD